MVDLFDVNRNGIDSKLHSKFNIINSLPQHKNVIQDWSEGFEDRDNKIIKEFQTTFHSSFWEIYLYAVFKKLDYFIDMSVSRPDLFYIKTTKRYSLKLQQLISKKMGRKKIQEIYEIILICFLRPMNRKILTMN
ncbi:hypothetical protein CV093_05920 [Oceanobacillus sp. 143]|nr:hypothetical protein CV093_05920 [Oceanobacillus sp. 143]